VKSSMVKKEPIPKPGSNFLKVKCTKCANEQVIFDRAAVQVKCNVCEDILLETQGGKAKIKGEVTQVLG
jgi:small subunit ribosomal protein S27e